MIEYLRKTLVFLFPDWYELPKRPDPPDLSHEVDPEEEAVDWKEFLDFLKSPAWREIRAEAIAELNQLNEPLPDDRMGHDQVIARGVREYVKARIHYYFVELPEQMLEAKAREYDKSA